MQYREKAFSALLEDLATFLEALTKKARKLEPVFRST